MDDEIKVPGDIEPYIVTVLDEENVEHSFEVIDAIETDTDRYMALIPFFDESTDILDDDGELIVLKVEEEENGEESLVTIEDEDEFHDIINIFEERLSQIFDFDNDIDNDAF